jgi:DNA-binding IclR family transcriptional regulator
MVQTVASAPFVEPEPPSILSKAFDLLRAFNQTARVMTLSELSRTANLPKSTVHRLLARLIDLDVIEHDPQGYRLSLSLIQLGATTPAAGLRELAAPHLGALLNYTGHAVHLGVQRHFEVVCLDRLSPRGRPESLSAIGGRLPASCTALGKALLAHENLDHLQAELPSPLPQLTPHSLSSVEELMVHLHQARARGVAYAVDEAQLGMSSIAAPIILQGVAPRAVAAISVSFPSGTASFAKIEGAVRHTARCLAADATVHAVSRERWLPFDDAES